MSTSTQDKSPKQASARQRRRQELLTHCDPFSSQEDSDPAQLLWPQSFPPPCCPKHLEEVEDIVSIEAVVAEAVQDLHPRAQGQLLESALPQGVGFPFLQLPAVVDDVLQVAVKRLGSNQGRKKSHPCCSLSCPETPYTPSNSSKDNTETECTWRKTQLWLGAAPSFTFPKYSNLIAIPQDLLLCTDSFLYTDCHFFRSWKKWAKHGSNSSPVYPNGQGLC